MGVKKDKHKRSEKKVAKFREFDMPQERMIEIQAEAFYRALKRLENEKNVADKKATEKKKYKWYEEVFFVINVFFFPWKIGKKFKLNDQLHDNALLVMVSGMLRMLGGVAWLGGGAVIVGEIWKVFKSGWQSGIIVTLFGGIEILFFGSILVLVANSFGKETDSNKIYAYSASVIALISCIVSIIALLKM